MPGIAIIIPCLNEAPRLPGTLSALATAIREADLEARVGLLLVDGGSTDDSLKIASAHGVQAITSDREQRARQLNLGAAEAIGHGAELLWFLHADIRIEAAHLRSLARLADQAHPLGGGFRRRFDSSSFHLRWTSWVADLRGRFWKFFYGDQAMFVRSQAFEALGGFDESLDIAEDLDFSLRLRELGQVTLLGPPVIASARRFEKLGPHEQIRRDRQFVRQWMKQRGWHDWRRRRRPTPSRRA